MTRFVILPLFLTLCSLAGHARAEVVFQELYAFPNVLNGPFVPLGPVHRLPNGELMGTTFRGGVQFQGTLFKLNSTGTLTNLLSFDSGVTGSGPQGMVRARDGFFYGATSSGGLSNGGSIFRVSPEGVFENWISLGGLGPINPEGPLAEGADGRLYGTSSGGGEVGLGTVFAFTTNRQLTTLASFYGTNGSYPRGLIAADDGALYGVTRFGGPGQTGVYSGFGTVYRVTTSGVLTTLLQFNETNGKHPYAKLSPGSDGRLYGTTPGGGKWAGGTAFAITKSGELTTLYDFRPESSSNPWGDLAQGPDGAFYGSTVRGATNHTSRFGTIYRLTTNGTFTTLLQANGVNARYPIAQLFSAPDRNLYGSLMDYEAYHPGSLFRVVERPEIVELKSTSNTVTVTWTSFPGGVYRVERKAPIIESDWEACAVVTAQGFRCSYTRDCTQQTGKYRIVLLAQFPE